MTSLDLLVDDDLHLLRLGLGLDELGLELGQLVLHHRHRLPAVLELLQAVVVPAADEVDLLALAREERLEGLDELEVARRRHVDLAPLGARNFST